MGFLAIKGKVSAVITTKKIWNRDDIAIFFTIE